MTDSQGEPARDPFLRRMIRPLYRRLRDKFTAKSRRRANQNKWETNWARADYAPPWLNRGVSPEITAAVDEGWFKAGSAALDIGCGQGEVAIYLTQHGFPTVGLDIASAAIARAQRLSSEANAKPEFIVMDICAEPPPDRQYRVIIDCGCFHQIPKTDWPAYGANILKVAAPHARMLLLVKAFRGNIALGDPAEAARLCNDVTTTLGSDFEVVRSATTFLDPHHGQRPEQRLPGMAFWLERRP